ncbi:uncharacterized protein isoform X1 [Musca autumnalis]|uniref:uncharacterized protein isoform X1 n=2 Tax=Musca autumnalis TaxID=221902 RepID=UPI003CE91712
MYIYPSLNTLQPKIVFVNNKIFKAKMSEITSIKTELFAKDYKPEDSNNDTNTLHYNATKLENFTNMENDIKEDKIDFDKMEEFLPENVDESTIDIIKEEDVDEMDEFLSEDSASIYSSSEAITHDEVQHQRGTQQHLTSTTTQEDQDDIEDLDINCNTDSNVSAKTERSIVSSSSVAQTPTIYKCELCGISYNREANLRKHTRHKHPLSIDTEYICEICNQRFTTKQGLDRHSYMLHAENQTGTRLKCELCGNSYAKNGDLERHMRKKHPLPTDTNICEICNQRFATQRGLDMHSYMMHKETQATIQHKCDICGSCYKVFSNLREHIRKKHPSSTETTGYICEICKQSFTIQKGLDIHYKRMHQRAHSTQTPSKHKCELCGNSYAANQNLIKHMRKKYPLPTDTTEYICEICNQRFATQRGRDIHLYKIHHEAITPTNKHKCEICGRCYIESKKLRIHIRNRHPSAIDTEYTCHVCHQRFITQKGLDIHLYKIHHEAITYTNKHKCEICGRSYIDVRKLWAHMRNKHPMSIDTEFICEICSNRFHTPEGLFVHCIRMHNTKPPIPSAETTTTTFQNEKHEPIP